METETVKSPVQGDGTSPQTDQNEKFSLRVKKEFVLSERAACLPPLTAIAPIVKENPNSRRNRRKNKRFREESGDNEKMCLVFVRGDTCSRGDSCKFSHDIKAYLASRAPDIDQIEGGCPHYSLYGFCMYGATCRLGGSHINMATGENLRKEEVLDTSKQVINVLDRSVQAQLRKNEYPFVCKRYNQRKKEDSDGKSPAQEERNEEPDMTPLPEKSRRTIDFSNKVYIAPLTTVGNLPFRRVMKKFGADITCGEMAVASHILMGNASEWALLKRHADEDIFGVQIAAGHADLFTRTCELIENHTKVDFVDLNLGCPLDIINDKGAGAALMMRQNKIRDTIKGITETLSCPVTIKMRTGWDIAKPFAHELVQKIQNWGFDGVGAIMIHGRSRLQRYSKEADWDYISKAALSQDYNLPKIPVIGNGDIFLYTDYEERTSREGISSCAMLARGALIKPWLPTEIKEKRHWDISATERLDILKDFVRFGLEHWGSDQKGVDNCRRFLLEWLSFLHRYVSQTPEPEQSRPRNCASSYAFLFLHCFFRYLLDCWKLPHSR